MGDESALILAIRVQKLDDLFYAASPDVPGLHVCGSTVEATLASAKVAIRELFKQNRGLDVIVTPASADADSFPRMSGPTDKFIVQRVC